MSGGGAAAPGSRFGRFEVRVDERRLYVDARPVGLGSRAFDLLAALVARRDRVVPKDELIDVVWPGLVVEENNLQVQISALRKVLGAQAIATVPGRGYQFTVAATAAAGRAAIVPSTSPPPSPPAVPLPTAAAARGHDHAAGGRPHRCRLLVADDNKVNRLLLCRSLELMGHEVATADNGRNALQALRDGAFDLLLLDLEMPELDGFGLLEQRAADPALREVPVIVTSSLEGAAAVARCIELGADDYLHKPVNPVLLKARVDSSLERKHLRDRQRELLARLAPDLAGGPFSPVGGGDDGGGRCVEATILVARLRDLDPLALAQPAQETLELLSDWATLMVDAVEGHGGLVNQISGAGLTAVFGAPEPLRGDGGAPWAAARAALEMRELTAQFNAERAAQGKPPIEPGIGVASGEIVAGRAGTSRRAAYVCIGAAVQRAAGLEAIAEDAAADAVLIDEATRVALAGRVESTALPRPRSSAAATAYAVTRAT